MTVLVVTRGLPASGKTTYARSWVDEDEEHRARVNRDDLRQAMFGGPAPLPFPLEEAVTKAQHAAVRSLLAAGTSVICDDMNLRARYVTGWASLAESVGAAFEVVDIQAPVDVCVLRDKLRERQVGEEVIRDLAKRFANLKPYVAPERVAPTLYVPDESLPEAWIVDIDGTLAHMGDRSPYDHDRVDEDALCEQVAEIVWALSNRAAIILASGRSETSRAKTEAWLRKHDVFCDALYMRAEGDARKDSIVKRELFEREIAPRYQVLGVFDDRRSVVQMWRSLGLFCAQVAPGDF